MLEGVLGFVKPMYVFEVGVLIALSTLFCRLVWLIPAGGALIIGAREI